MIVEDDPAILNVIKIVLEINGYEVVITTDGYTVQKMKKDFPDLLLLDIWMLGINGRAVCKYLKSQESTRHIPIIMVSASKDLEQLSREAGADDFVAKPFEMDELLNKIKKYTSRNLKKHF